MKCRLLSLFGAVVALLGGARSAPAADLLEESPRIALVPFAAPDEQASLAKQLTRELARSLKGGYDVVELTAGVMAEPLETCVLQPACVDRVLRAGRADALIAGQIEWNPDTRPEPLVLISVIAPRWPVSYVERYSEASSSQVTFAAQTALALAQGETPPAPGEGARAGTSADEEDDALRSEPPGKKGKKRDEPVAEPVSKKGKKRGEPVEQASSKKRERSDRDEALDDDALRDEPSGHEKSSRSKRKKKREKDLSAERLPGEAGRPNEKPEKPARARAAWPARAPHGPWRGLALEVQAGGAFGAMNLRGVSQVAVDTTGVESGRYRWAIRESGVGWVARVGLGFTVGNRLELGLEAGALPAAGEASFSYFPEGQPTSEVSASQAGLHILAGARVRWFLSAAPRVRPYVGLGASIWLSPAMDVPESASGPHAGFGPYQRFAIEPALGARVLLVSRLFLGIEARGTIDPANPYLEKQTDQIGDIPVSGLTTVGEPGRVVGSLDLGLGVLW